MINNLKLSMFGNFEKIAYTRENIEQLFKLDIGDKFVPIQYEEINLGSGEKSKRIRLVDEESKINIHIGVERLDFEVLEIENLHKYIKKGEEILEKLIAQFAIIINRLALNLIEVIEFKDNYFNLIKRLPFYESDSQYQFSNIKTKGLNLSEGKSTKVNIITNFLLINPQMEIGFDINTMVPSELNYSIDDFKLFLEESLKDVDTIKYELSKI